MSDEIQFSEIDYRPKTLTYENNLQFKVFYKIANTYTRF